MIVALLPDQSDLDWPAVDSPSSADRKGLQITLGRCNCLPSCRNKVFSSPVNFNSKLSVNALM
jgi:hypothetical protein